MPCTNNATTRHVVTPVCTQGCCQSPSAFSSGQVCCAENDNYDTEWTPFDMRIIVNLDTGTDPIYTLNPVSIAVYKVSGKTMFIQFSYAISAVSNIGNGTYLFTVPSGFNYVTQTPSTLNYSSGTLVIANNTFGALIFLNAAGLRTGISANLLKLAAPATLEPFSSNNVVLGTGQYIGNIQIQLE